MRDSVRSWGPFCLSMLAFASGCGSDSGSQHADGDAGKGHSGSGGSRAAASGGSGPTGGSSTGGSGGSTGDSKTAGSGGAATSGTSSSGGHADAGNGGTLPHMVGECDGLAEVGPWEEITPEGATLEPPYKGTIVTLLDPQTSGTLYSTTFGSGIFKSTDCGASWDKINTGQNGDKLDAGSVWSAVIDPVDPQTIFALSGYGTAGLWKSTDGGVNWNDVLTPGLGMPGFVARVALDPTNHAHVFINFHDNCTGSHTPVCFGESTDSGASWNVIDFPTSIKDAWGEGTFLSPLDETHWLYQNWEVYYTSDSGASWSAPFGAAVQGEYFNLDGDFFLPSGYGVLRSTDSGASWSQIANSGFSLDAITGDGSRLFALRGFQPPDDAKFVWSASYDDLGTWTLLDRPGSPEVFPAGGTHLAYDADHHLLYIATQAGGLWRTVTK